MRGAGRAAPRSTRWPRSAGSGHRDCAPGPRRGPRPRGRPRAHRGSPSIRRPRPPAPVRAARLPPLGRRHGRRRVGGNASTTAGRGGTPTERLPVETAAGEHLRVRRQTTVPRSKNHVTASAPGRRCRRRPCAGCAVGGRAVGGVEGGDGRHVGDVRPREGVDAGTIASTREPAPGAGRRRAARPPAPPGPRPRGPGCRRRGRTTARTRRTTGQERGEAGRRTETHGDGGEDVAGEFGGPFAQDRVGRGRTVLEFRADARAALRRGCGSGARNPSTTTGSGGRPGRRRAFRRRVRPGGRRGAVPVRPGATPAPVVIVATRRFTAHRLVVEDPIVCRGEPGTRDGRPPDVGCRAP